MQERILITHALWSLGRAGAERVVLDICSHLVKLGFRTRVITMVGGGALEQAFRDAGIEVALGPQTSDRTKLLSFLEKELKENRPTILHTHLGADLWAGHVAKKQKIKNVFVTLHNEDRGLSWVYHLARARAYRQAKQVICISKAVQAYAIKHYRLKQESTRIIHLGVHVNELKDRGTQTFYDVPRLITAGRLTAQKDQRTLLRALARVKRPWQLEICGSGELEKTLMREAGELGILAKVRFSGSVTDLADRFARSDIFCFPSRWEGQGLALLEAAGCGLPCIASDLPVFRESFDERSMFFAKPGHEMDWMEKINHILGNAREALARAKRAQLIVREQYTVERMVKEYEDIYRVITESQ